MFAVGVLGLAAAAAAHGGLRDVGSAAEYFAQSGARDAVEPRTCGAPGRTRDEIAQTNEMARGISEELCVTARLYDVCALRAQRFRNICASCAVDGPAGGQLYTIKVAFHVIYDPDSNLGWLSDEEIDAQMQVLNEDFAGLTATDDSAGIMPFQFELDYVSRTGNADWFRDLEGPEFDMRRELAYEPATHFQIYSGDFRRNLLGYCYFPSSFSADSFRHGCSILYSSLPGNPGPYGLGRTLSHEIGHGVGLDHVFVGENCFLDDFLDDTPLQSTPTDGCPPRRTKDSCPGQPGFDDTRNIMDYSYDSCMEKFSPAASAFMLDQMLTYRPNLLIPQDEIKALEELNPGLWHRAREHQRAAERN